IPYGTMGLCIRWPVGRPEAGSRGDTITLFQAAITTSKIEPPLTTSTSALSMTRILAPSSVFSVLIGSSLASQSAANEPRREDDWCQQPPAGFTAGRAATHVFAGSALASAKVREHSRRP